jgi:hypothetical protein
LRSSRAEFPSSIAASNNSSAVAFSDGAEFLPPDLTESRFAVVDFSILIDLAGAGLFFAALAEEVLGFGGGDCLRTGFFVSRAGFCERKTPELLPKFPPTSWALEATKLVNKNPVAKNKTNLLFFSNIFSNLES